MRNWSGSVEFSSASIAMPTTVDEVQQLVARTPLVHPLGTGHSFNDIADTAGMHVSVAGLPATIEIDSSAGVAWIPAGMRYGDAATSLDARGWAFHNMASLGHISVGGSVATGTHGSGDRNPTLSAMVQAMEIVTATGDLGMVDGSTDPDLLAGSVVGLGALGVVTRLAVRVQPRFEIQQYVFDGIGHEHLLDSFDEVFSSAYSVSFFTTWSPSLVGQVWMKRRVGADPEWAAQEWQGGALADAKRHPLPGHDAVNCTDQGGLVGAWHDRLPHFRLDFTPSSGDELQTEYLVPRSSAVSALRSLESLAPRIAPLLHVSEIRTMCGDDLWLSGASGRDTVGIHFTWQKVPGVAAVLPELDEILGGFGGRPHWGKIYSASPASVRDRYPRFGDFADLVGRLDPGRKFRNRALDDLLD